MNKTRLSKMLSFVLRHEPEAIGLKLDSEGWAQVDELLACLRESGKSASRSELEEVVAQNNKQRFRFSDDGLRIRANQGHSIQIDLKLEPATPPHQLYHGTATRFLSSIFADGLVPGSRQHVHLSAERSTALAVGRRHGKPVTLL
ncbi:MAG: RNA 2'-phosphotransferase, partial [Verrucomicrobiota bacterium]